MTIYRLKQYFVNGHKRFGETDKGSLFSAAPLLLDRLLKRLLLEVTYMRKVLNQPENSYPFREIVHTITICITHIEQLLREHKINPFAGMNTSPFNYQKAPVSAGKLKIGIYPVAANPFHWGHLLTGLLAIAQYKLDKVVYLIAGNDVRKPDLLSAPIRHLVGREIVNIFSPFFAYSSIALETNLDGESNVFRILNLNQEQPIDVFYLVGSDHYHRINKQGYPDTICKIEKGISQRIFNFNPLKHAVSVVFIKRETNKPLLPEDTWLNTYFLDGVDFKASSTMIRDVFQGKGSSDAIAILPYTVYLYITSLGLYQKNANRPLNLTKI